VRIKWKLQIYSWKDKWHNLVNGLNQEYWIKALVFINQGNNKSLDKLIKDIIMLKL
jgi:hypothetical protein